MNATVRFSRRHRLIFLLSLTLILPTLGRAQLVADGQTNILDGVFVGVTGDITVATNLPFTWLTLTNGTVVTNSGNQPTTTSWQDRVVVRNLTTGQTLLERLRAGGIEIPFVVITGQGDERVAVATGTTALTPPR